MADPGLNINGCATLACERELFYWWGNFRMYRLCTKFSILHLSYVPIGLRIHHRRRFKSLYWFPRFVTRPRNWWERLAGDLRRRESPSTITKTNNRVYQGKRRLYRIHRSMRRSNKKLKWDRKLNWTRYDCDSLGNWTIFCTFRIGSISCFLLINLY